MTSATDQINANRQALSQEDKKVPLHRFIEPGITHLAGLLVYLIGGLWIYTNYNESIFGFLGVVMLLWAGFKALIVLAIYGFAGFALIFRPEWFANNVERRLMVRLKKFMDRDIEQGKIDRAIDRAHGMLSNYPYHRALRRRLASLLIAEERYAEAGRHLIYLPNLMEIEKQAVTAFYEANGRDPFQILRKSLKGLRLAGLSPWDDRDLLLAALPKDHPLYDDAKNYDPDGFYTRWVDEPDSLPQSAVATIRQLHGAITHENELNSRLYRNLLVYFGYKDRSRLNAFLQTNRNALIEIAIGVGITAIMMISFYLF